MTEHGGKEFFRAMVDHSPDLMAVVKPDGACLFASPSGLTALGYAGDQVPVQNLLELVHPDDRKSAQDFLEKIGTFPGEHRTGEFRCLRSDGAWISMEWAGINQLENPAVEGIIVSARDVSERLRILAILRENEARFQALAESSPSAIFIWQDEAFKYVNSATENLTGFSKEELYRMRFWELIHPDERDEIMHQGFDRLQGRSVPSRMQFKVTKKNGETSWADVGAALVELNGRPAVLGSAFDITEYKKIDEELRSRASELQAIFRAIPDLFFRFDKNGIILDALAGQESDLLMPRDSILGKNIRDVTPPFLADLTIESIALVLGGSQNVTREYSLELGGHEEHFESRYTPIPGGQVIGIVRNITEKKKTEGELARAQKLESIGLLAGGIAHDFNNILSAILGNISLAKFYAPENAKLEAKLLEAEKSVERARDLTRQLLTFSRGGAPVKKTIQIGPLLGDTANLALSGSQITCRFSIDPDLLPLEADEGQLSQVINNIILNAKQAMQEGGAIAIDAKNITIKDGPSSQKEYKGLSPGNYILITVADRGTGIPREHMSRIFEPYFSLKENGMGLGLATSYSIIKRHKGDLHVVSQEGKGTTIKIYLPASSKSAAVPPPMVRAIVPGKGKILVMDDEPPILDVCREMLQRIGYTVKTARDGEEALKLYREAMGADPFDAVILDLTIRNGMGGRECVEKLLELDHGALVLVSSGYSNNPIMSDYRRYGFRGMILKPYDITELSCALAQALKSRP